PDHGFWLGTKCKRPYDESLALSSVWLLFMRYKLCFGRPRCPSRGDPADVPGRPHVSPHSACGGDFDACKVVVGRQFPSFLRAAFQAQLDRFPDIAECLPSRAALADTARNHGTLRNYVSVMPGVEYDWQLHVCREYHLYLPLENGSRSRRRLSAIRLANFPA